MGTFVLLGILFAVLMLSCCFYCAANEWELFHKYQQMLDEHRDNKKKDNLKLYGDDPG